jgi:hypothetical protein
MYPHSYFDLYPPLPHRPLVFVAMSFDSQFEPRYRNVIVPAIQGITHAGAVLQPHRVDSRSISDSILTEILQGIGHDVLVLADISTIGHMGASAVRNANVMYEIGLAHAVRPAEEIVIFRSDRDALAFDVANIRVNFYAPDTDPTGARETLMRALLGALNEIDSMRALAVEKALNQMNGRALSLLMSGVASGYLNALEIGASRGLLDTTNRQNTLDHLLRLGAVVAEWPKFDEKLLATPPDTKFHDLVRYRVTELGQKIMLRWYENAVSGLTPEQVSAFREAVEAFDTSRKPARS